MHKDVAPVARASQAPMTTLPNVSFGTNTGGSGHEMLVPSTKRTYALCFLNPKTEYSPPKRKKERAALPSE